MKKKWTLSDQLKRNFKIDIIGGIIVTVFLIIFGIVFCVKKSVEIGLIIIGLGVFGAIGVSVGIIILRKDKEQQEAEETEKARLESLASEAIRMKEEQEKRQK